MSSGAREDAVQKQKPGFAPWFGGAVVISLVVYGAMTGFELPRRWLESSGPNAVVGAMFSFLGGYIVVFIPTLIVVAVVYGISRSSKR
jgi:hypothetical protein